jgi:hypothetical protein
MSDVDEYQEEFWSGGEVFSIIGVDLGVGDSSTTTSKVVKKSEGCVCTKCGEFYQYAEPNQEDDTFKCWGCRH